MKSPTCLIGQIHEDSPQRGAGRIRATRGLVMISRRTVSNRRRDLCCAFYSLRKIVDDFVAAKALEFNRIQHTSILRLQQAQQQSLRIHRILQISIGFGIWFGTRGSEVQILSPRPIRFNRLHFRRLLELSPWCRFCGCPKSSVRLYNG